MEVPLLIQGIAVIAGKDMRLYYTKPPVLMFGVLFPLFMFFAFFVGRQLDLVTFFPGFLGMMVFFTASSVGPLITPWEKREKTYERLLSYPVTQDSIILGDILAGVIFGLGIGVLVWIASTFFVHIPVTNPWLFALAFLVCLARGPPRVAGIRQPAQRDDLLKPGPIPAHLYLGHLRAALAAGRSRTCPCILLAADLSCGPVQRRHGRVVRAFPGHRLCRACRSDGRILPCDKGCPETEPGKGVVKIRYSRENFSYL